MDIILPEWFFCTQARSEYVILENIFTCVSAIILCPTSVRIAVCQYVEIPFIKSVIIIAIGMIVNICVFLSKKIILIAGSKIQAVNPVESAVIIIKKNELDNFKL